MKKALQAAEKLNDRALYQGAALSRAEDARAVKGHDFSRAKKSQT